MKLVRPKNIKGIDFSAFRRLETLEVSFGNFKDTSENESQLKLFFNLLRETPRFKKLKITASSLTSNTFIALMT